MPIYEYECKKCGYRFEVRQNFDDEPPTECPSDGCDGEVHRLFSPPTIIFKGSGFYVNDHKQDSNGAKKPTSPSNDSADRKPEAAEVTQSDSE